MNTKLLVQRPPPAVSVSTPGRIAAGAGAQPAARTRPGQRRRARPAARPRAGRRAGARRRLDRARAGPAAVSATTGVSAASASAPTTSTVASPRDPTGHRFSPRRGTRPVPIHRVVNDAAPPRDTARAAPCGSREHRRRPDR